MHACMLLTYMVHGSCTELRVEDFDSQISEIFDDERPDVEDVVSREGCTLLQDVNLCAHQPGFDGHPEAAGARSNDHHL